MRGHDHGFVLRVVWSGFLAGCGISYPEPAVGPPRPVEADPNTFARIQADILTPSCARVNCHGTPRASPMSLEEGFAYENLVGVRSTQASALHRVEPFAPEASYLLHKVRGTAGSVEGRPTRMPLNRSPLSEEAIARLEAWILAGAPHDGTQETSTTSDSGN